MRMTNKIMQNNSLYNINLTKVAEDKLNTQMTTESRIVRPSDDPVVAIRALRLRSSVSTVSQYYEKNAPDADQWLDVTAGALTTTTDILTSLYKQAEKGADQYLQPSDLQVILDQMKAYTNEFYATGNQDYAGRFIFTGYRTDTALTMENLAKNEKPYNITQDITANNFDEMSFTYSTAGTGDYNGLTDSLKKDVENDVAVKNEKVSRIRLAYDNIDATTTIPEAGNVTLTINGVEQAAPTLAVSREDAYKRVAEAGDDDTKIYLVKETGELVLGKGIATQVQDAIDKEQTISVTYEKSKWDSTDLNPIHYFKTVAENEDGQMISYNEDGNVDVNISYDVGYNQKIQVNTNAYEVFSHDLQRDIDELQIAITQYDELNALQTEIKAKQATYPEESTEYKEYQAKLEAVQKAMTFQSDAVNKMMQKQMTRYQGYMDQTNLAITKNGTRSTRLEMIGNRLMEQKSTFKELQEENEGIDMTETAVKLASAELTYQASLQATSKIMQNSLMQYI